MLGLRGGAGGERGGGGGDSNTQREDNSAAERAPAVPDRGELALPEAPIPKAALCLSGCYALSLTLPNAHAATIELLLLLLCPVVP